MSETTYTRRINIYVDSGQALAAQEVLLKKQDAITASIKKYVDAGKEVPEKLTKQLNSVTEALERQSKKLSGELTPNLKELASAYQKTNAELSRMSKEDAGFEKKRQETIAAKKALDEYKSSLGTVASGWQDMLKTAGGVALGVLAIDGLDAAAEKIKEFFGKSVEEALQAEEAASRLKLALENYGDVDALDKLTGDAERLATQFKYLDNDDIIGAQEKLVTYGKLSIAQIQELTPVIIDYAAKSKQSLGDATQDIIKGLNGQGRELKNYGIELEKGGTVADNFGVIIEKLGGKVKGSADEFSKSAAGGFAIFKQTLANIEENLGLRILPFLNDLAHKVSDLIAPSESLSSQFEKQKAAVDGLEKNMPPLLNRYDELKGKTTLTKDEQGELKKIIEKVGESIPTAISQFDKYGNALDINSDKARGFIQSQKDYLKYINQQAIAEQEKDLKDFTRQWAIASRDLERGFTEIQNRSGDMVKANLSPQQIKDLQGEVSKFQQQINGVNESLKKLRGDDIKVPEKAGGVSEDDKKAAKEMEDADKMAEYIKKLRAELHVDRLTSSAKDLEVIRQKYAAERAEAKGNKEALAIINTSEAYAIQEWALKNAKTFEDSQKSKLDITKATETEITDIVFTEVEKRALASKEFADQWKKAVSEVKKEFDGIQQGVQGALGLITTVFDGLNQKENQELAHDKKVNSEKEKNLKKQLDAKKISQRQYDAAIHGMNQAADAKQAEIMRKQFERNKAIQIVQTIANTAAAVVAQLANPTPYVGIALAALAAATGIAQIAVIAAQEPPSFGEGTEAWRNGIGGVKHSHPSKGNPVIDPTTGKPIAYLEEDEAIISAKNTKANPGVIRALNNANGKSIAASYGFGRSTLNATRAMENVAFANGTMSFQNSSSGGSNSTIYSNNTDNGAVLNELKGMREELRAMKDKKVVFSKDAHDKFETDLGIMYRKQL